MTKSELEELGEETDNILSTSKLQSLVKAYTGVDIMLDKDNYKDIYTIVSEIGEPFIIAKTIIEHCEASGACGGNSGYGNYQDSYQESYQDSGSRQSSYGNSGQGNGQSRSPFSGMHYIDLNKWYWKLLAIVVLFMVVSIVFRVIGGIFVLLIRFSGPLMMFFLVYWVIKNMRGR